jgi:hypothetical protein
MPDIENNAAPEQNNIDAGTAETILTGDSVTETKETPAESAEGKTDAKDTGDKDTKDTKDTKETPEGAPEKYEDFKVPEGFTAPIEEFTAFAKEMNMSQEGAQKVVDFFTNTYAPKLETMRQEQIGKWREESEKQFKKEDLEIANRGMAAFSSPELKELLGQTGLGNHPQIVKLFNLIGTKLSESNLIDGKPTGKSSSDRPADKLFGTTD